MEMESMMFYHELDVNKAIFQEAETRGLLPLAEKYFQKIDECYAKFEKNFVMGDKVYRALRSDYYDFSIEEAIERGLASVAVVFAQGMAGLFILQIIHALHADIKSKTFFSILNWAANYLQEVYFCWFRFDNFRWDSSTNSLKFIDWGLSAVNGDTNVLFRGA